MSTSSVIAEAEFSEIVQAQGTKTADGRDWGSAVTSYTGCIESRDPGHCCPPDLDSNTLRQQASYSFRPTRPGDRFARAYLSVFSRSLVSRASKCAVQMCIRHGMLMAVLNRCSPLPSLVPGISRSEWPPLQSTYVVSVQPSPAH